MKIPVRFLCRCVIWFVVLTFCIHLINMLLVPKFYFDNDWPTTTVYTGFYQMDKNSVDVLFLGSSHAGSFFLPQEIYNNYGIQSYNLGCAQQNMLVSYYWLKEALRFQNPKVVVLDCYMLFPYRLAEPLNTDESGAREAIDFMKWSAVKANAVRDICKYDKNQSAWSYYFPNIRYHARWAEVGETDFSNRLMQKHYELKGFAPFYNYGGSQEYQPFEVGVFLEKAPMVPVMKEYLDKIVGLCRKSGITLILTKTPGTKTGILEYNSVMEYANAHNIKYIDFNDSRVYHKIEYSLYENNDDDEHGNIWGACKVSNYIGELLQREYGLGGKRDEQWERTRQYYEEIKKEGELLHITDGLEYLKAINQERYCIFIAIANDPANGFDGEIKQALLNFGLEKIQNIEQQDSYAAVVSTEEIKEDIDIGETAVWGTVRNKLLSYEVISKGSGAADKAVCSIFIDGTNVAKRWKGLNIAIYNLETRKIIDSVNFDTYSEGIVFRR